VVEDVAAEKLLFEGVKEATTKWVAAVCSDVEQFGTVPEALTVTWHRTVPGATVVSMYFTVPCGIAPPGVLGVTVDEKVTGWLTVEAVGDDVRATVMFEALTT
jgi:hypothetical protein